MWTGTEPRKETNLKAIHPDGRIDAPLGASQHVLLAVATAVQRYARIEEDDLLHSDPEWKAASERLALADRFVHRAGTLPLIARTIEGKGTLRFENSLRPDGVERLHVGDLRGDLENDAWFQDDSTLVVEIDGRYQGRPGERAKVIVTIEETTTRK